MITIKQQTELFTQISIVRRYVNKDKTSNHAPTKNILRKSALIKEDTYMNSVLLLIFLGNSNRFLFSQLTAIFEINMPHEHIDGQVSEALTEKLIKIKYHGKTAKIIFCLLGCFSMILFGKYKD